MSVADIAIAKPVVAGGQPVRKTPFAPWPFFGPAEIEAATAVLQSGKVNYWTGQEGRQFEKEFAAAWAVNMPWRWPMAVWPWNWRSMCWAFEAGRRSHRSCRTFVASASCVVVRGATPVFADVDRDSQNITADSIRRVLSARTKAIIVVHLAGWPCDMDPILELARQHDFKVIEDCAQAQGATYKGRPSGSSAMWPHFPSARTRS